MSRPLRLLLTLAASAAGTLAMTGVANAATFTVNDPTDAPLATSTGTSCVSTDSSSCTLRAAVQAADNSGGASTITVPAGTYTLAIDSTGTDDPSTGDLDIDNNASVTINGAGSSSTVIDSNSIDRAFAVQDGAGLTLSGMTIENGEPSGSSSGNQEGGAIYSDGALTLSGDVTLFDNSAFDGHGGAIYTGNDQTSLSITGTTFAQNTGYDGGGALYLGTYSNDSGVQQSITDSVFSDNHAPDRHGGAFDAHGGSLTVSGSTFTGNTSSNGGGAIHDELDSGFALTLTNNTFDANSSQEGGALYLSYGNLTASGNTFTGNAADYYGGAIYQDNDDSSSTASVYNNTFDHNSAYDGGVLYNNADDVAWSFSNNTLARNTGTDDAGGIYDPSDVGGGSTYANNIVAESVGGDCGDGPVGTTFDAGNNLDSDSSCFATGGTGTTPESSGDLVSANPDLGPLADNGGPTETDALLSGSPAINAGNTSLCPATDQRGVSRPQGSACDIGAFEVAASALLVSNGAPSSATAGIPFVDTISVKPSGPGPSTGTTVTDQLPSGETLYGATPSQGSCSSSGSPAKVTCDLGAVDVNATATVTLLVSEANAGSVTDTATATNDQGASVSASATTKVASSLVPQGAKKPKATTKGHAHVTKSSAKLKGKVSNGGQATWYFFQYGRTKKLGSVSGLVRITKSKSVSAKIKHLLAGRKYFFRLVAINDSGKSYGKKHSFKTK